MIVKKKKECKDCGELKYIIRKGLCSYCNTKFMLNDKESPIKRTRRGKSPRKKTIRSSTKKKPQPKKSSNKIKKRGKKSSSITFLKKKLWSVFSKFIRLRDSNESGYCACITCDRPLFWKEAQAGHFISRRFNATFVEEKNVNAQCAYCNLHMSGNQYLHGKQVDIKCGEGTSEQMYLQSKQDYKFTTEELEEKIVYYSNKVVQLLREKGLPE